MTAEPSEPKCSLPWSEYLPLSTTSCLHQQTSRITKVAQKTTPFKLKHLKLYLSFHAFAKGSLNRSSGASRRTHDSTPAGRYVPQGSGPGRAGTATIPEQSPRQSPTLVHETESTDAMETSQARNPGWDLPTQDSDKVLNHAGALTHVSRPAGGGGGGWQDKKLSSTVAHVPPPICQPASAHGPLLGTVPPLRIDAPTLTEAVPTRSMPCDLWPAVLYLPLLP